MKSKGLVFKSRDYIGSAEPPAAVLEDESRYGNDATIQTATWVQLPSGLWVKNFDGSDKITIPADESLFISGATISFWLWRLNTTNMYVWDTRAGTAGSHLSAYCYMGAGVDTITPMEGTVYVDGVETNQASVQTWHYVSIADTLICLASSSGVQFGVRASVQDTWWYGKLIKFTVHNYVRSVDEIASSFQAERHWFGV